MPKRVHEPINKLQRELINARKNSMETLEEVGKAIGTSKSHVWELESTNRCNPGYDLLGKLVKHYNIDLNKIF